MIRLQHKPTTVDALLGGTAKEQ